MNAALTFMFSLPFPWERGLPSLSPDSPWLWPDSPWLWPDSSWLWPPPTPPWLWPWGTPPAWREIPILCVIAELVSNNHNNWFSIRERERERGRGKEKNGERERERTHLESSTQHHTYTMLTRTPSPAVINMIPASISYVLLMSRSTAM